MARNPNPAPTSGELRCAGISLLVACILLASTRIMFRADYSAYAVRSKEDIIKLHETITDKSYRTEVEIASVLQWISFPLYLLFIGAFTKFNRYVFFNTRLSLVSYCMEKAYLSWILILCIIFPAISLVQVSLDWNFDDGEGVDIDNIPAGYYNQLYIAILQLELIDSSCIAEAVFLISVFATARYMTMQSIRGDRRFNQIMDTARPCKACQMSTVLKLVFGLTTILAITFFVIFALVMCEFADSGIFAPDSRLKGLLSLDVLIKIMISLDLIFNVSRPVVVNKVKALFANIEDADIELIADVEMAGDKDKTDAQTTPTDAVVTPTA